MPIDRSPTEEIILNDALELARRFQVASAADDLLAALEWVVSGSQPGNVDSFGRQTAIILAETVAAARAAIAKATGQ